METNASDSIKVVENSNTKQSDENSGKEPVLCIPVQPKKPKRTDDEIFSTPNRHIWVGGRCPCCD